MFIIKFTTGNPANDIETSFSTSAYTVRSPADSTKSPPVVSICLGDIRDVYDMAKTMNVEVADKAFVMNEGGKTIQVIKNYAECAEPQQA
jgi:hypothetical protein